MRFTGNKAKTERLLLKAVERGVNCHGYKSKPKKTPPK
jgi:hypothetical protein